ncbi:hypothetical protein EII22_08215 [Coriobacteriales bacterium OH1046]|nr:hypothetical protein EII22_08215 [Coriobacteriales bacterium OH1046]
MDEGTTHESILPDFEPVLEKCRADLDTFKYGDYEITGDVRSAYRDYERRFGAFRKLEFYRYSFVINRRDGECWVPGSTLVQCTLAVPYYNALMRYKHVLNQLVAEMAKGYASRDKWCEAMRDHEASEEVVERCERIAFDYFTSTYTSSTEDDVHEATRMFMRFLTDKEWWGGGKAPTRADWYQSPISTLLRRSQASNEIALVIVDHLAKDSALRIAVSKMPYVEQDENETVIVDTERRQTGDNIIVYGAPGTGKSYAIENDYYPSAIRTRVMFHPEYSYFDFVGTFRPTPVYLESADTLFGEDGQVSTVRGIPHIDYSYHAGPFTQMVVSAWEDKTHDYCLIIEEINRANAAAVFGDMFQLLDRKNDHSSDYAIRPSNELASWLRSEGHADLAEAFRIPSNMSIVATMNSADLGVTFLDAAFKRRFNYRYVPIDLNLNEALDEEISYNNSTVTLRELFGAVNDRLAGMNVNEDRRVGPFFVGPLEMKTLGVDVALRKVVMYLWDDVFRDSRSEFFAEGLTTLGEVEDALREGDPFCVWDIIAEARASSRDVDVDDDEADENVDDIAV